MLRFSTQKCSEQASARFFATPTPPNMFCFAKPFGGLNLSISNMKKRPGINTYAFFMAERVGLDPEWIGEVGSIERDKRDTATF